jgi:hypothetical protein
MVGVTSPSHSKSFLLLKRDCNRPALLVSAAQTCLNPVPTIERRPGAVEASIAAVPPSLSYAEP